MTTTPDLPEKPCHRTRFHTPHVRYENFTPVSYCPGVGEFFPADRLTPPADPFDGIPADEEF